MLRRLAESLAEKNVAKGTMIWGRDDPYRGVCVLVSGKVKVSLLHEDGREYAIRHLCAPDCFGRTEALDEGGYTAYVEALEPCRMLTLTREKYLGLVEACPAAAMSLLRMFSRRIRDLTERIETLIWEPGDARLIDALLRLGPCGERIDISQAELAKLVNISREKLSARLGGLRRNRIIETGRGWIRLLQRAGERSLP
jgi:CRP-like cAMP-binding protein